MMPAQGELGSNGRWLPQLHLDRPQAIARFNPRPTRLYRTRGVGGHGEDQQQLLEIGAVNLRVSVSDRRRRPSANLPARRRSVASVEANRGTVVVKLIEVDAKALADRHHDLGEQCSAVGVEQPIQSTSDPIVAEMALDEMIEQRQRAQSLALQGE